MAGRPAGARLGETAVEAGVRVRRAYLTHERGRQATAERAEAEVHEVGAPERLHGLLERTAVRQQLVVLEDDADDLVREVLAAGGLEVIAGETDGRREVIPGACRPDPRSWKAPASCTASGACAGAAGPNRARTNPA
jgi:hypothetical protein